MNILLFVKGAVKVNFAFCMFDMQSADEREVRRRGGGTSPATRRRCSRS